MLNLKLEQLLQTIKAKSLYRSFTENADISLEKNFARNDYLALASNKNLKSAFLKGFQKYPLSASASAVAQGYQPIHHSLEQTFAKTLNADDGLLFSSGYNANLSIMTLLAKVQAKLIIDKAIHASVYDGIKLNQLNYKRFRHNDLNHLALVLAHESVDIIATEGIFSMSGQIADLTAIHGQARSHLAHLYVDEAHSFGIMGKNGLGATVAFNLTQAEVPLRLIAFGKSMAYQGAIVVGDGLWIEALRQVGRSQIYSTAISPAVAYGLHFTLDEVQAADEKRMILTQLIDYFNEQIINSPLKWGASLTPIQRLYLNCPKLAVKMSEALKQEGFLCAAIRQPTVLKTETGLRIVLNAHHQPQMIKQLFKTIHQLYEKITY